jgi:hypothetical protein
MERHFVLDHYEFILDVWYIALLAMVIFFLNLSKSVQIGLLIACGVAMIWALHTGGGAEEPPCGSEVSGEPVARSKGGFRPS